MKRLRDEVRSCEQVRAGHPDKLCDRIADTILDEILRAGTEVAQQTSDHSQRSGIEALAKDATVVLSGEIRALEGASSAIDYEALVRDVYRTTGYDQWNSIKVVNLIGVQQPELQSSSDRRGAGDQGIMIGFATDETPERMPLDHAYATAICRRLDDVMGTSGYEWVRPDGKAQVTLDESGRPSKVVIGVQHADEVDGVSDRPTIQNRIKEQIADDFLPSIPGLEATGTNLIINGSGSFAIGGPWGDAGVVGRKIVCDAYGPGVPVGGGAFSGKDPTKVDRSAAYMARLIALRALEEELSGTGEVTVRIAFSIGSLQPEMLHVATERGKDLSVWAKAAFPDLSPAAIADCLGLWDAGQSSWAYRDTAAYGHFGRSSFPWEL